MNDHFWTETFKGVHGGEVQRCTNCNAVRTKHLDGKTWRIEGGAREECPRHPHVWDPDRRDDDDEPIYD